MIYFICDNDYQVMKAAAYAVSFSKPLTIFSLGNNKYNNQKNIDIYYPNKNLLLNFLNTIDVEQLTDDDKLFVRVMFDIDTEVHAFQYLDQLFLFNRDDIILHDQGDSSYVLNKEYLYGEANMDTMMEYITQYQVDDDRNLLWDFNKVIQSESIKKKIIPIFNSEHIHNTEDVSNTILFVHNEPDSKYTFKEKREIYVELNRFLKQLKQKGYKVWVKTHHKRNSFMSFDYISDKVIKDIPLELVPDLDKFKYVISVRNSCLENMNKENFMNGLTKAAITKCKKNWKYVYLRGITKLKKKLNLTY